LILIVAESIFEKQTGETAMPAKKAKPTAAQSTASGNIFNVQGGIHAKRDVIMRDQHNTIHQTSQTLNISTPSEFIAELAQLKAEIERLKQLPNVDSTVVRRLGVVQDDIQDVIAEAKKEAPAAQRIKSTLDGAKETMEKLGGSITSAVNLGTLLGNLAVIAFKVFGG